MRILGVTQKWDKLQHPKWTTFRFPRRDKDWQVGEQVQVVFKPRSKQRESLGIAGIVVKESRAMAWLGDRTGERKVSNDEAIADGFKDKPDKYGNMKKAYFWMWEFLWDCYGGERLLKEPINKLTLKWVKF